MYYVSTYSDQKMAILPYMLMNVSRYLVKKSPKNVYVINEWSLKQSFKLGCRLLGSEHSLINTRIQNLGLNCIESVSGSNSKFKI
jgi:hypothetical protein